MHTKPSRNYQIDTKLLPDAKIGAVPRGTQFPQIPMLQCAPPLKEKRRHLLTLHSPLVQCVNNWKFKFKFDWFTDDIVDQIDLPIHDSVGSGGFQLRVRLETGRRSCLTAEKAEFSLGDVLSWRGNELGECVGFTLDSSSRIQLRTGSTNSYAVQGSMTINANSIPYHAIIPTNWRQRSDNSQTYDLHKGGWAIHYCFS